MLHTVSCFISRHLTLCNRKRFLLFTMPRFHRPLLFWNRCVCIITPHTSLSFLTGLFGHLRVRPTVKTCCELRHWLKPLAMQVPWNLRFGIVILGDSSVGKSSLLHRFTEGTFDESRQSPLGIDFMVHNVTFDPDVVIKLLLWDTAGQERFRWVNVQET